MRRTLAVIVLLALAVATAGAKEEKAKGEGDVSQAITKMENQWAKDALAGNAAGISAILADDFVNVDSDGSTYGKAELLDRAKKAKWTNNALSDIKVTVHGRTAIATGIWTGKGTSYDGKAVDAKERWADTWVKDPGGKWLCIASASTPMKK